MAAFSGLRWPPASRARDSPGCATLGNVLVREQPATDLAIATRILARAHALADDGRITLRLRDVMYIGGRDAMPATMTPYDVAVLLISDGSILHGEPPSDVALYLARHADGHVGSVARGADGTLVAGPDLRSCAVATLRRARGEDETDDVDVIERTWLELVADARVTGALVGAFPVGDESG